MLAIECDGASYHSCYTARDRDRLRQQHLEALGWQFHRIWSTDWFLRKEHEVVSAVKAYEAALARANENGAEPAHNSGATEPLAAAGDGTGARARHTRPRVPRRGSISEYGPDELIALIRWIRSDDLVRSDEELVAEVAQELGFSRRGVRIEAEIRAALAALGAD